MYRSSFLKSNFLSNLKSFSNPKSFFCSKQNHTEAEFDDRHREYIIALKAMPYSDLLLEQKKYPGKPSSRSKIAVLNFILSHLSKKKDLPSTTQKLTINKEKDIKFEESVQNFSKDLAVEDEEEIIETPITISKTEAHQTYIQDTVFSDYVNQFFAFNKKGRKNMPFMEIYSPTQILAETNKLKEASLRNEALAIYSRSELFRNKLYESKLRLFKKREMKNVFYELVLMEGEYQFLTIDRLTQLIQEIKTTDIHSYTLHQVTKMIADPLVQYEYISFFKWAPISLINLTWLAFVSFLEIFTRKDLIVLLNCLNCFKTHLKFSPADEASIYEKISNKIVETITNEPECFNLHDLASILMNYKILKFTLTDQINKNLKFVADNFFQIFLNLTIKERNSENTNQNLFSQKNQLLEKSDLSPSDVLNLMYALSFCLDKGANLNILLQNIFSKLIIMGLRNFEKGYVLKILTVLMSFKLKINEEIATEIQNNKKAFENLTINEIYIYIQNFRHSNMDSSYIYQILSLGFYSNMENLSIVGDFKLLIIIAEIQAFFLSKKVFDQRKVSTEKKIINTLAKIENSLEPLDLSDKIDNLFFLSNLFNPYLNIPDYLFKKILSYKDKIILNTNNKSIIMTFVQDLLKKYEPKYTFINFTQSFDIDFIDKITPETIELFSILLKKFKESNLLSFHITSINILNIEELRKNCFSNKEELNEYVDFLANKIIFSLKTIESLPLEILKITSKFIFNNGKLINQATKDILIKNFIEYNEKIIKKNDNNLINTYFPIIYYLLNFISSDKDKSLQQQELLNKMSLIFENYFHKKIKATIETYFDEIVYDNNIVQSFCRHIKTSNLENLEYLCPIFDKLNITEFFTHKTLLGQIQRVIKTWSGPLLLENLLILSKNKVNAFQIFNQGVENLSSFFVYYISNQKIGLNKIYTEKNIVDVLKSYIYQYENFGKNGILDKYIEDGITIYQGDRIVLSVLTSMVMNLLEFKEILKLIQIIGKNEENYFYTFIDKFKAISVNFENLNHMLHAKIHLPMFLKNKSLDEKIYDSLKENKYQDCDIMLLSRLCLQEKIWIENIFLNLNAIFNENPSKELASLLLNYIYETGINLGDYNLIFNLITKFDLSEYSDTDLTNFLLIILSAKIRNSSSEKFHFLEDTIGMFYKSQRNKSTDAILLKIIEKLFKTPQFGFFENKATQDNKEFNLKYDQSFELTKKKLFPSWKILPSNESKYDDSNENQNLILKASELSSNRYNPNDKDNSLYPKEFIPSTQKHYLYSEFSVLTNLPLENEILTLNFKKTQNKELVLLKSIDEYANFLVEFSLILNLLEVNYKTNFECPESDILIDLVIPHKKIGFLFVNNDKLIKVLQENKIVYTPDNLSIIKAYLLETLGGWKISLIVFDEWVKKYDTRKKKEIFISEKIN